MGKQDTVKAGGTGAVKRRSAKGPVVPLAKATPTRTAAPQTQKKRPGSERVHVDRVKHNRLGVKDSICSGWYYESPEDDTAYLAGNKKVALNDRICYGLAWRDDPNVEIKGFYAGKVTRVFPIAKTGIYKGQLWVVYHVADFNKAVGDAE